MSLRGHSILIVESEVGSFVGALQEAIDATSAESVVACDRVSALERLRQFEFDAALINARHKDLVALVADFGGLPFMLYVRGESTGEHRCGIRSAAGVAAPYLPRDAFGGAV